MAELAELGKQDETNTEAVADPIFADIQVHAHWVLPAIDEILKEQPQLTFTAQNVFEACEEGTAVLWVADEGFVVSSGETDPFTGDRAFLVWLAWAREIGQNCVVKHYSFFAKAAKEAGFKTIEVRTPIPKMEQYLLSEGWDKDTVIYTREL